MNIARWNQLGYALMALAVVAGAFGAHLLKSVLSPVSLLAWQTAVMYHFIHALGLLLILPYTQLSIWMQRAARLLYFGIICFSGSLYLLACKDLIGMDISWLGPITPAGGIAWIAGWICAIIGAKDIKTQ